MGGLLSTPSTNPSDTHSQHATMSSSNSSRTPESKQTERRETPESKTQEPQNPAQEVSDPPIDQELEEEEEGESAFCQFMKAGGCRYTFIAWEKCIEDAKNNEENTFDKCFMFTAALKRCMEAHPDYYSPILQAEKAVEEEAVRELEKEKAKEAGSSSDDGSEERLSSWEEEESKGSQEK